MADVIADHFFIASHRRYKVPSSPEVLSYKVALLLALHPRQVNDTFALDVAHHLRYRIFRRNRDHHVNVIDQQMPFFYPILLVLRQGPEHLPEVLLTRRTAVLFCPWV